MIRLKIGCSRFGYKWGFFACFHARHAFMLWSLCHTVGNQTIWNAVAHTDIRQCQVVTWCMWTGAFDSTSQNDKRFAKPFGCECVTVVQQCLIKSVNCSKSFYGVFGCIFMWHDTSPRCTFSILASLLKIYAAYSGFIGVCWLCHTCRGACNVHVLSSLDDMVESKALAEWASCTISRIHSKWCSSSSMQKR